ncbi:hypothetical protein E2C01_014424 [Portunus trituberculatus]|uniref:Uncharacterized protein n=1 Tax=Portunus trituberculatus TaxID=210409 RepID=A0A5B7DJ63_PORTR|nr:hypothetical protein [Portunus trituberculatus]
MCVFQASATAGHVTSIIDNTETVKVIDWRHRDGDTTPRQRPDKDGETRRGNLLECIEMGYNALERDDYGMRCLSYAVLE